MRDKHVKACRVNVGEILEVLEFIPDSDRELIKDKIKEIEQERS